jgi:hypothetical protein
MVWYCGRARERVGGKRSKTNRAQPQKQDEIERQTRPAHKGETKQLHKMFEPFAPHLLYVTQLLIADQPLKCMESGHRAERCRTRNRGRSAQDFRRDQRLGLRATPSTPK